MKSALIVVDVQNDFCPGGSLAVERGDEIIAPLNHASLTAANRGNLVIATRDYHPADATSHFEAWPAHCVRGTWGAEFHPALVAPRIGHVLSKGTEADSDDYSAFDGRVDFEGGSMALDTFLARAGVDRLWVGGLATDYCVRATVLDALNLGLAVRVSLECIAAVDAELGDGDRALQEMYSAGAAIVSSFESGLRLNQSRDVREELSDALRES